MRILFSILLIFILNFSIAQIVNNFYVAVPSDSLTGGILKFIDDSTVELSSTPTRLTRKLKITFPYISTDSTVEILSDQISTGDSFALTRHGWTYFLNAKYRLAIINNGFIDENNSLIYIRGNDLEKDHKLTYIINGESYTQDIGFTDSQGIIHKSSGNNKKLQKILESLKPGDFSIQIFKGLKAYKKFGVKKVFGVIVINSK